jgi:hypothetical protein
LLMYTDAATSDASAMKNAKKMSHAVFGHTLHRPRYLKHTHDDNDSSSKGNKCDPHSLPALNTYRYDPARHCAQRTPS